MSNPYDYHIGDSRNLDEIIKGRLVDVIITSPPYWNLKDYEVKNQIGFGQKYDEYIEDLMTVFKKCKDVLKENGSLWVVADSFKQYGNIKLLPFDLANRLKEESFFLQDVIIWQKDKTLPWSSKGKLRNIFEYVLFFTKNKTHFKYNVDRLRELNLKKWWVKYPERYNPKGKVPSRVWTIPIPIQGWGKSWVRHFCPFPPELVEKILLLTTDENDVVIDPFAGSGSVLAQATVMKRNAIGFDLNKDYREMYFKTVLPFFEENWKQNEKKRRDKERERNHLEETIKKLRILKYPVSLLKELKKEDGIEATKHILGVIASDGDREHDAKFFFVLDSRTNDVKITQRLSKISRSDKLKKFSMKPKITAIKKSELTSLRLKEKIYIYSNGITNYYNAEIKFRDLLEKIEKNDYLDLGRKLPPVISDIKVYQKTPDLFNF